MSQVYSTEPQTTGRVILQTTAGPIDINLWCKECPNTTRVFLQLCLDGYYNRMMFHRILNGFLIQTGLIRSDENHQTENKKCSKEAMALYLKRIGASVSSTRRTARNVLGLEEDSGATSRKDRRKFEINPRLRFNHRGQVALALPLDAQDGEDEQEQEEADDDGLHNNNNNNNNNLALQFFITLDEAPYLDTKHVIFGTVSGPTIFNALRIGRTEVEETTNCPVDMDHAPMIQSVKIEQHPFDDLVATDEKYVPWRMSSSKSEHDRDDNNDVKKRKKKRKGKKDLNVLSFGDEMQDLEGEDSLNGKVTGGMMSSHDVVGGTGSFLGKEVDETVKKSAARVDESISNEIDHVRERTKFDDSDGGEMPSTKKKRRLETKSEMGQNSPVSSMERTEGGRSENVGEKIASELIRTMGESSKDSDNNRLKKNSHSKSNAQPGAPDGDAADTHIVRGDRVAAEHATHTKDRHGREAPKESKASRMSEVEARRAKYLQNKAKRGRSREEETMAKLLAFKSKVLQVKGKASSKPEHDETASSQDNSLASRMASKQEAAEAEKRAKLIGSGPSYHGQLLEGGSTDDENESGTPDVGGSWLKTKFKCRKHVDHMSATDGPPHEADGEDGRDTDDYVVIDEKGGGRGRRGGDRRDRRHRHHRDHGGRTHSHRSKQEVKGIHHGGHRRGHNRDREGR